MGEEVHLPRAYFAASVFFAWRMAQLTHIPLFPPRFRACLENIGGSTYIGIWGQFVRADGSGNEARLAEFRAKLLRAQRVDEAIDAFPFKVFEAVGPVQEFFEEYHSR